MDRVEWRAQVEAAQWLGGNAKDVERFCRRHSVPLALAKFRAGCLEIKGQYSSWLIYQPGDWVIRTRRGQYRRCSAKDYQQFVHRLGQRNLDLTAA